MRILVTGGAGFVGSHLALALKEKFPSSKVIALDNLKRRGSELNLSRLSQGGVEFMHGDVRNPGDLGFMELDWIIECSAEPSALAGRFGDTDYLVHTNLLGTYHCLELARRCKAGIISTFQQPCLSDSSDQPILLCRASNSICFGKKLLCCWGFSIRDHGGVPAGWGPYVVWHDQACLRTSCAGVC